MYVLDQISQTNYKQSFKSIHHLLNLMEHLPVAARTFGPQPEAGAIAAVQQQLVLLWLWQTIPAVYIK